MHYSTLFTILYSPLPISLLLPLSIYLKYLVSSGSGSGSNYRFIPRYDSTMQPTTIAIHGI